MKKVLSKDRKEDLALALILLKDFKCQGKFDVEISKSIIELALHLEVSGEYYDLLYKIPPMKVEPRHQ